MKNFKEWISERVAKSMTKSFLPMSTRVKLHQPFYGLSDEQFLKAKIADERDVDGILQIERLCYNGQTPWNRTAILHEIRYNKNAFYIVMYDDDEPVAFVGAWFVTHEAHITNIATIPAYEKKGIATYLLKEIIRIAQEEDIAKVTLEVRMSNHTAQSLYRTLGFEDVRVKKGYYARDHEDALEMSHPLEKAAEETIYEE
ncbi:ribosomal protein S18-alanine N-acetyltransferase [Alkalibacterium subtropicum]|uniref:ribosomal protein S18-alanine N-acetyltransferase n=1 Tax=Alkalibacterium subtropicum TaxID=753702 RepID=UPI000B837B0E|nr:ribosomal protein S18-alanine N-acetyltransferase [Alkalibacterium subtropicum]